MEHKNLALVNPKQDSQDGINLSDKDIVEINNSLLSYSRKWNKEFKKLNKAGDDLVKKSNSLNAQTANFNKYIGIMHSAIKDMLYYLGVK